MLGKIFKELSYLIVILAALNIGVESIFHKDLIVSLFGENTILIQIIRIIVGVAGIISLVGFVSRGSLCGKRCCSKSCHTKDK